MSGEDSSTSESEVSACSSNYNPMKALYSEKTVIPVKSAPVFENIHQFEASLKHKAVIPVSCSELVRKREEEKKRIKEEEERRVLEKNKQRFAKFQGLVPTQKPIHRSKNVLTRIETMEGPLRILKECVDTRLRIKVITRKDTGVRGWLHATLVAFDKQWNLALTDVLEVWHRKQINKRKIIPTNGKPVPKGSAHQISPVPVITETPIGKGKVECSRHIPQLLVRGEHVVLVNVVERGMTLTADTASSQTKCAGSLSIGTSSGHKSVNDLECVIKNEV